MSDLGELDDDYEFCAEAINFNSQYNFTLEDGKSLAILGRNYGENYLFSILKFVKNVEDSSDFKIKDIVRDSNLVDLPQNSITEFYPLITGLSRSHDPDLTYGPHVQLFYDVVDILLDSEVTIESFKNIVKEIRLKTQSKYFKRKACRRRQKLEYNEKTAISYIDKIFKHHARLMILRLDFHLSISGESKINQYKKIRTLFAKFLNGRRSNKFFDHELGYLWKFEDGESRGGHYHLIFILDGSRVQKGEFIASQIGEFWRKITDGEGTYFNANSKKYLDDAFVSKGRGIGVGRIESYDTEKRAILGRVVKYFFKMEQYVEAKLSRGMRSFGKGKFEERSGQGGRPRKKRD